MSEAIRLSISGMMCAGCVATVEDALKAVPGVSDARVNLVDHSAVVDGDAATEGLIQAVRDAGYEAAEMSAVDDGSEHDLAELKRSRNLFVKAAVAAATGLPLMFAGWMGRLPELSAASRWDWLLIAALVLGVMAYAGGHYYLGAWKQFRRHNANMDTLVALGTGAAWLYSTLIVLFPGLVPSLARQAYFEAAVVILAFVNFGSALEIRVRGKTSEAIRHLIGLQPKTARVLRDGKEIDIPVEEVGLSETVRIRPGERIPVDGEVIDGHGVVDESMLTGEPVPVEHGQGDSVAAGTINKNGSFLFKSTRIGRDTTLARIVEMVREAQSSKPDVQRLVDRIASYFVPAVLILSVLTALIWFNVGPEPKYSFMLVTAMTVLLIACPCALGLATPISITAGVGRAAELGVLIRNGEAMQKAAALSTVVFDKTGTLTEGRPSLQYMQAAVSHDQERMLQIAASLEQGSEHPLASAILDAAKAQDLALVPVGNFHMHLGGGVSGEIADMKVTLGNARLMQETSVDHAALASQAAAYVDLGATAVYLTLDGKPAAVFCLADRIHPQAKETVHALQEKGIEVVMITGDNQKTAEAVARQLGIREIAAEVLPGEKSAIISEIQKRGRVVGMVGDGINDAPALARADVGFAISSGTDVALASADVALMGNSPKTVLNAIHISEATNRNIWQNLAGAFIYNLVGIPVAAGLLYPLTGHLLNPMLAGAAMAASSLTVVTNANRLRWYQPPVTST